MYSRFPPQPEVGESHQSIEGAPPIAADPGGFPDFRILCFFEKCVFWKFPGGFGIWGGVQSIGTGCGIQMDGFSAQTEPYGFMFDDVYDFGNFAFVSDRLTLFPEFPSYGNSEFGIA